MLQLSCRKIGLLYMRNTIKKYLSDFTKELDYQGSRSEHTRDNYFEIYVNSKKKPVLPSLYKKNGTRYKEYKDIPFQEKKTKLIVATQQYFDVEKKQRIPSAPLSCMVESHKITKRLANYTLQKMCYKKYKDISRETGIALRTIHLLYSEWYNRVSKTWIKDKVYIFPLTINKGTNYVVLDSYYNAMKIAHSKEQLTLYLSQIHPQDIVMAMDIDLCEELNNKLETRIHIDLFDFQDFVVNTLFNTYKKERQYLEQIDKSRKIKSRYKQSLEEEHSLFIKPYVTLGNEDKELLNVIHEENHAFYNAYYFKENILSAAKSTLFQTSQNDSIPQIKYLDITLDERNFALPKRPSQLRFDTQYMQLLGMIEFFKRENIRFIEIPGFSSDIQYSMIRQYEESSKRRSDNQFILLWNRDKDYI